MRQVLLIVAVAGLISCASPAVKQADQSPWEAFGYKGMADKINQLGGEDSLNCGIRNYLNAEDPVNAHMSPADSRQCIKSAIKTKTPFRYGTIRIPIDSYLFDALVLAENGQFWIIRFDAMIDGTDSALFVERCESVTVDYQQFKFSGSECKSFSQEEFDS